MTALRPSLEDLMGRVCSDPDTVKEPMEEDQSLQAIIREMCKPDASTVGVDNSNRPSAGGA